MDFRSPGNPVEIPYSDDLSIPLILRVLICERRNVSDGSGLFLCKKETVCLKNRLQKLHA